MIKKLFTGGATAFSLFPDLGRRSGYEGYNVFSGPRPQVPMPPSSMALSQISPLPMRPAFNGTGFPGSSKLMGNFYIFIANFFATQIIGGAKKLVVLLLLSGNI